MVHIADGGEAPLALPRPSPLLFHAIAEVVIRTLSLVRVLSKLVFGCGLYASSSSIFSNLSCIGHWSTPSSSSSSSCSLLTDRWVVAALSH
jgi:hypothetical protein